MGERKRESRMQATLIMHTSGKQVLPHRGCGLLLEGKETSEGEEGEKKKRNRKDLLRKAVRVLWAQAT